MSEEAASRLGTKIGNYRLARVLGTGGMGAVFLGEHIYLGRKVAVKILHGHYASSDDAVGRFLREACAASAINHPNIIEIIDFGEAEDGSVFLVMEYLDGESLNSLMQREKRIDLLRAINIMKQIASALGAAHDMGIFHRDLKPENIVISRRPGRRTLLRRVVDEQGGRFEADTEESFDFVKVLDFGVAKVLQPKPGGDAGAEHETAWAAVSTQADTVFGTPEYIAPEAARGAVADARCDIYAVGVIFYEMLTGSVPFSAGSAVETIFKHIAEPVIPPGQKAPGAEITEQTDHTVLKALAKNPDDRYQTMAELYQDLKLCYGAVVYQRDQNAAARPAVTGLESVAPAGTVEPTDRRPPETSHTLPLGTSMADMLKLRDALVKKK